MALYSESHRLLFIMNPRTGCTATGRLMTEQMGGVFLPAEDTLDENGKVTLKQKHTTLPELKEAGLVDDAFLSSVHTFTTVRNPFDSLVSLWTKKKYKYVGRKLKDPNSIVNKLRSYAKDLDFIQDHTFSEWVVEFIGKRENPKLNARHLEGVSHFLRFEDLQGEFDAFLKSVGIEEKFEIPLGNVTKNRTKDYRSYYSDEARDVVQKKYANELTSLGYEF